VRRIRDIVRGLLTKPATGPLVVGFEADRDFLPIETTPGEYTLVGFPEVMWMGVNEFADLFQDSVPGSTRDEANEWAAAQVEKRRLAYIEAQGAVL
jgi:hypothetical protein